METRDHENSTLAFLPEESTISVAQKDQLRERIKIEFYKTYDVMTGIRIAATLGGFFSMMILLVLYKNYCKPSKTLSEEQLNAAVTAAAEEEDRALQAALEATSFYTALDKRRQSIDNANQVLLSPRFSSVGGGYSHLTPPLKASFTQQRGKSLPGSVLQFGSSVSPSFFPKDKGQYLQQEDQSDFMAYKNHLNAVPSRRVSSVTCFSADSAYLERRCSAFEIGIPVPPHFLRSSREKLFGKKEPPWDYYYPIDIQVIQPTPEISPSVSERNLNENYPNCGLQVPGIHEQIRNLSLANFDIGLAPLASISSLGGYSQSSSIASKSFNTSSSNPPDQGTSVHDSTGSDSVFIDVDEMATDSEFEYDGFDDDYSFCETKQSKPSTSRPDMKTLKFASFDSYDASIKSEVDEEESKIQPRCTSPLIIRKPLSEMKRRPSLHEGSKKRRKLVKTYSEPRSDKVPKTLPPWTEKGRSNYVPKRQMSPPSRKRAIAESARTSETSSKDTMASGSDVQTVLPTANNSSSDSAIPVSNVQKKSSSTSGISPRQGLNNDLPSNSQPKTTYKQLSLPTAQERRSRLQKQKNFIEEVKLTAGEFIEEKIEGEGSTEAEDSSNSQAVTSVEVLVLSPVSTSSKTIETRKSTEGLDDTDEVQLDVNS